MNRAMLAAVAVLVTSALAGCGSSGNHVQNPAQNYAGLNPTVAVSPATANVPPGSKQQFAATVTNSVDDTVTWEVGGVAGGNSTVGTIDINGVYTAPAVAPIPSQATVTALLNAAIGFSGSSIVTITPVVFNNSSLKGNYILSLKGIHTSGSAFSTFYAVGVITADANGNITGGEEDMNDMNSGAARAATVTGTYSVGSDGRGMLSLSSSLGSFSYAIALQAAGNASLNEADKIVVNATGSLEGQADSVAAPSGNYAFGFAGGSPACGPLNSIGVFGLNAGAVSGVQDLNCGGTITQSQGLSGAYGNADGLGRGTGSFSATTGTTDFVYYVVSANRYRFLCPDTGAALLGSADLQTKTVFAASDFNGLYVIASSANAQTTVSSTLIEINASGGNVSAGYIDINNTGAFSSSNLIGAYSLSSNGNVVGTFNTTGNANETSFPFSMYLVSSTRAYYLDLGTSAAGGGTAFAQSAVMPGDAAWAGSFANEQFGYFTGSGVISQGNGTSVSGQISADGNGLLSGTLDFNDPTGVFPGLQLQGSYSVGIAVPGRTSLKITTSDGTRNYIAYIVDQGRVQMLEIDSNITAVGNAILQF